MTNKLQSSAILDRMPNYPEYDAFDFYGVIPRNINVAIYGTGTRGEELYTFLTENMPSIHIVTFVDSFNTGTKFGLPVVTPDALLRDDSIDLVIICSLYTEQVIGVLRYLRIVSYIIFSIAPRFSKTFIKRNQKRLMAFRDALQTDKDKALLDLIVEYRQFYKKPIYAFGSFVKMLRGFCFKGDYLDHINMDAIKCIYDLGSYNGDSASHFIKSIHGVRTIYCFDAFHGPEMVQQSYPAVVADPRVHFITYGVSDKSSTKYGALRELFPAGGLLGDKKDDFFAAEIKCITIDDFVRDGAHDPPDLIKMDIENFEVRALKGALNTIKTRRMQYAISIYHSEQHLLEVFEFLSLHCPDYIFNLAHYNKAHVNELILFAIPKELHA